MRAIVEAAKATMTVLAVMSISRIDRGDSRTPTNEVTATRQIHQAIEPVKTPAASVTAWFTSVDERPEIAATAPSRSANPIGFTRLKAIAEA